MLKRFSRNELLSLEYECTPHNVKCLVVNTYYFGHENDQKALTLTWADHRDIKETSRDIFRIFFEVEHQEKLLDTIIDNLQIYRPDVVKLHPDVDGNFVKVPLTTYTGKGLSFLNHIIVYGWMKEADFNRISPYYVNKLFMDYPELVDTITIDDLDESIRSEDEWEQLLPFEKFNPIVYLIKNGYCYASIEWFGNYNPIKGFNLIWDAPSFRFPSWLSFPTQEEAEKFLDIIKSLDTSLDNAEIEECDYGDKCFPEDKKWFLKVKVNAYGFPLIGWIQKNTAIKALKHETKEAIAANPAKGTNVDNFSLSSLDDLDEAYNTAKVSAMSGEELRKLFDVIKVNKYYRVRRILKNSKDACYNYPVTQLCYDSLNGGFDYRWDKMISNFQRQADIKFTSEEEAQIFLDFIATSEIRKNYDLEVVDVNIYGSRELVKIPIYISVTDIIQPVYVEWTPFFQQTPDSTLSVLLNNPITGTRYKKQSLSTLDDLDEGISWIKYIK